MTQTQTEKDGTGRRTFIKGVASLPVAAAGIGAMSATGSANVVQSAAGVGISGPAYLVGRLKDHFSGLTSDDEYDDLQEESFWYQTRGDATTMKDANDSVLTAISNLDENATSAAYQHGRSALIESINEGSSPSAAIPDAIDAIDEYIIPNQKNIVDRYASFCMQIQMHFDQGEQYDLSTGDIWQMEMSDAHDGPLDSSIEEGTVELANGEEYDQTYFLQVELRDGGEERDQEAKLGEMDENHTDHIYINENPFSDESEKINALYPDKVQNIFDSLTDSRDQAISDIEAFADGIDGDYQSGDIDTEDLVTPSDLWEMSSDDSDNPYAAADLSGLGLEINQESSVVIDLLEDGETIEGDVYLSQSPMGESLEVGTVYDPTLSRSTDEDDEIDDEFADYDGDEDDPVPIDGIAYIAYNLDEGSTYGEINQPFEVTGAFDEDGEELENVSYEPSTGQQTTTTDIDELRDELQSINDELIRVEEERNELATGGGIGFGSDGGTLAAAVGVGAILFALLSGGGGS